MNRSELIKEVSNNVGLSQHDVEIVLNGAVNEVANQLSKGENVTIADFGRFEMREKQEKKFTSPKTGQFEILPASKIPGFKASTLFKDRVKKTR